MAYDDFYEIEEFFANEISEAKSGQSSNCQSKRKWREIERYKENEKLHRELLEYYL